MKQPAIEMEGLTRRFANVPAVDNLALTVNVGIAAHQVHQLISRLIREQERTVFLCIHDLAEAQQLCQRAAVLEHGRLLALGTPADLARQLGLAAGIEIEAALS